MTETSQNVDINVVTPALPALPVCPESVVSVQISDCAQQAFDVLAESSHISTSSCTSSDPVSSTQLHTEVVEVRTYTHGANLNKRSLHEQEQDDVSTDIDTDISELYTAEESINNSSVPDSEGNLSVSTDETLHNSDSDSFGFASCKVTSPEIKMGNQQSGKKSRQSDDDTPDESKTKCCEIPKKKVKDRYSKTSRSSKSGEDFDFEDDELYPFESRTRSEHEIVDPVELEPFEIIETDDIKFIPGAGTSDVIKSASESKFKTIPEEECVDTEEKFDTFIIKHDKTLERERVALEKGGKILEPGTSTATSTFEFKPVKSKQKTVKPREEKQEPTYENIQPSQSGSNGSSRKGSSSSSNDASRKNSKECIQKPTRQKNKKSSNTDQENKDKINKSSKTKSKQTQDPSDVTQGGSKSLILTQTMFSIPNPKEIEDKAKVLNENSNVNQNSYENVNVGVKFGPKGITICNTIPEPVTKSTANTVDTAKHDATKETPNNTFNQSSDLSSSPNFHNESHVYETLNSQTPTEKKTDEKQENVGPKPAAESGAIVSPEHVPPPSPLALEILEEEEEEEEVEEDAINDEELINEVNKRKSEIMEFTESVCKRLSQLLEDRPSTNDEINGVTDAIENNEQFYVKDTSGNTEHIYETVTKDVTRTVSETPDYLKVDEEYDLRAGITETCPRPPQREDSSSTLKRTSGDSVTYPMTEFLGSSDDDLPDYFDPKSVPPKRDSEILCDVLDAYSEESVTSVSPKDVADIVRSHTLEFGDYIQGHSTNKADKSLSLPLQEFDDSLINKAPKANKADEIQDRTPVAEIQPELTALPELVSAKEDVPVQYDTSGRQSVTYTESDLDISEHRDDLSTDSMLADDEDEETMEILFTKTYTEPVEGGEVFLSCTVVNSAYKDEHKKSETWLSDEALEYFEANAADVMSTAFMKAKKEMKDIQICLQSLRKQMEHFHDDVDDISLPDIPVDALSPSDYFGLPRKAVTD